MSKTSKTYFVIGNGPSVKTADLNALQRHQCLAANRFHLSYKHHEMRPAATFCIDPQMVDDHIDEIARDCQSDLFIPRQFVFRALRQIGLRRRKVRYFPFDRGDKPLRFSFDFHRASGNGANVLFTALQYAASHGAQEIFLYGVDHSFDHHAPDAQGQVTDAGENNHFIAGYRAPGSKWFPPDIAAIEAGFSFARKECEQRGIRIWNATRGGKLDIFERLDFDDALERARFVSNGI